MFLLVSYLIGLVFLISSFFFLFLGLYCHQISLTLFIEWEFFNFNEIPLIMLLMVDWVGLVFGCVVLLISSMVMFYSSLYMSIDSNFKKFILLVLLFVMSMILLIFSPNLISILLGWDGLGLVSYCLVIFYENQKSSSAGMLTILSNRLGDVLILLGIAWMMNFGSCSIFYLQMVILSFNLKFLFFLVLLAAMTKSAQMPFSAWLPAAMAAPTPVSSLVHSSTLVTAGVFLLIRFNNVFEIKYFLYVVSLFTMFMSGVGAFFETDLKKIIALSTLSQLGLMMMTLCFGLWEMAFFHLLTHALFKSLLFLCAGSFIHSMMDWQDSRMIKMVWVMGPTSVIFFINSSLSLCGFPFLSGFYSKDLIMEFFFMSWLNFFIFLFSMLCILSTFIYSLRLFQYVSMLNSGGLSYLKSSDTPGMYMPMVFLFILSSVGGSVLFWLFFPLAFIYLNFFFKLFIIMVAIMSPLVMAIIFFNKHVLLDLKGLIYYLSLMWGLPFISSSLMNNMMSISSYYVKIFDQGWGEILGSQGGYNLIASIGEFLDFSNILNYKNFFYYFLLVYSFFYMIM